MSSLSSTIATGTNPVPRMLDLQQPSGTADSFGQLGTGWTTVYSCWAEIAAFTGKYSGREIFIAGQLRGDISHLVTIRYPPGQRVTAKMRFRYADTVEGDRFFNIIAAVDPDESKTQLQCFCRELKT